MAKTAKLSPAQQKALALLLAKDKREPLPLNPVEGKSSRRLTPAEHKRLIAQGLRKRRNDALYAL